MRAVRGQVIPPTATLKPPMLLFQGEMFGLQHREFGGHFRVDVLMWCHGWPER